jgi:hypothetical protein
MYDSLINTNFQIHLLAIVLVLIIVIYTLYTKIQEMKKSSLALFTEVTNLRNLSKHKLDFENDISFLAFLIDFKISNYIQFNSQLKSFEDEKHILNDKMFEKAMTELLMDVLSSISTTYTEKMNIYFDLDGLINYISEQIYVSLLGEFNKHNIKLVAPNSISGATMIKNAIAKGMNPEDMKPVE